MGDDDIDWDDPAAVAEELRHVRDTQRLRFRAIVAAGTILMIGVIVMIAQMAGITERDSSRFHRSQTQQSILVTKLCAQVVSTWDLLHYTVGQVTTPVKIVPGSDIATINRVHVRNAQLADEKKQLTMKLGDRPKPC